MNPKIKSFLNSPWTIGIVLLVIPLIPITYYWKIVIDFLLKNVEVPIWVFIFLLITLISLILFVFWLIAKNEKSKKSKNIDLAPEYLKYNEDKIEGTYFRWTYIYYSDGIYIPYNIKKYCFDDKCSLISGKCPICKKTFISYPEYTQLERVAIIRSRIESKYGIVILNN